MFRERQIEKALYKSNPSVGVDDAQMLRGVTDLLGVYS